MGKWTEGKENIYIEQLYVNIGLLSVHSVGLILFFK
jgi:hypothetical protein